MGRLIVAKEAVVVIGAILQMLIGKKNRPPGSKGIAECLLGWSLPLNVGVMGIQFFLGHASIAQTLDTYSHVLPGMDGGVGDAIDKALTQLTLEFGSEVHTYVLRSYLGWIPTTPTTQWIVSRGRWIRHVHTNRLEVSWSLLKWGIKGTYVSVEPYHLFSYLNEQAFRFNQRDGEDKDRFAKALGSVAGRRVTYNELTGKIAPE